MTPTGSDCIKQALGDSVFHVYLPYDYPWAVAAFLNKIKPKLFVIMETELWPNLINSCYKRKIPIILANARLSAKSYLGYKKIKLLSCDMLNKLTSIAVQAEDDAKRFIKLGVNKNKINITGNIKFDIEFPVKTQEANQLRLCWGGTHPVLIAASTHAGEEKIILDALQIIKNKIPDVVLVLVPRHPERFLAVENLINKYAFKYAKRSTKSIDINNIDVYLGDTMGDMALLFAASDVAFIGGSFATTGGHNMLEAVAVDVPVITGPHLHNFATISQKLLEKQAMVVVHDTDALAAQIINWLHSDEQRAIIAQRAREVLVDNQGAVARITDLIIKSI